MRRKKRLRGHPAGTFTGAILVKPECPPAVLRQIFKIHVIEALSCELTCPIRLLYTSKPDLRHDMTHEEMGGVREMFNGIIHVNGIIHAQSTIPDCLEGPRLRL